MDSSSSKNGSSSKSSGGAPFLFPFRSKQSSTVSSVTGSASARLVKSQSDTLRDMHAAIDKLLQPKSSTSEHRSQMRYLIDALIHEPTHMLPLLDPKVATPLVSSLTVLCSRVLRGEYAYDVQLLSCEMLAATLKYAELSTQQTIEDTAKEMTSATGWDATLPTRALSTLDRSLLFHLIVRLTREEDWAMPLIRERPWQAIQTLTFQLTAIQALTRDGRDVMPYRGLIDTLTHWLSKVWGTMLMLQANEMKETLPEYEHCTRVLLSLLTSICKFSASRLEKEHMELILRRATDLILHPDIPTVQSKPETATPDKNNAFTGGFSYYGIEAMSPYFGVAVPREASMALIPPVLSTPESHIPATITPADQDFPSLSEVNVRLIARLLEAIICYAFIPTSCIAPVVYALCRVIGLPVARANDMDMIFVLRLRSVNVTSDLWPVLNNVLRSHVVHLMLRLVYQILCTPHKEPRSVRVGSLLFVHATLIWSVRERLEEESLSTRAKRGDEPPPLLPLSMVQSMIHGAIAQGDDALDLAVMLLLDDFLPKRESMPAARLLPDLPPRESQSPIPLCRLYGDGKSLSDWDVLPELIVLMNRHMSRLRRTVTTMSITTMVLHALVVILCGSPVEGEGQGRPILAMPWAAATFWKLSPLLPDDVLLDMVRENQRQNWYLPSNPLWLDHMVELLDTFYPMVLLDARENGEAPAPKARLETIHMVTQVYEAVQDIPSLRNPMIERVLMPLASRAIRLETNLDIGRPLRKMIRHAIIASVLDPTIAEGKAMEHFIKAITQSVYKAETTPTDLGRPLQAKAQHSRQQSVGPRDMDVHSGLQLRMTRATRSVRDLIFLFHQLAFGPLDPSNVSPEELETRRMQDRIRTCSMAIFQSLLRIVRNQSTQPTMQLEHFEAPCTVQVPLHIRQYVLRWLLRLRANRKHAIYFLSKDSPETMTLLSTIVQSDEKEKESKEEERGRSLHRRTDSAEQTKSGQQAEKVEAAVKRASSRTRPWYVDPVDLDLPECTWTSEIWQVYHHDHNNEHARIPDVEPDASTPALLPISEYLSTIVFLLQNETEWELVSCIMALFPAQLSNRHLFCGPKTVAQTRALRDFVCPLLLEQRPLPHLALPDDVRRTDFLAMLYATLKVLVSYQSLFTRAQQDEMVEAFVAGLGRSQTTAQPCTRALIVACHELPKSFTLHVTNILVKLSTIMSSITMSVHILELLAEICSIPALYANFTEADYRRIFGIALQYIQFHESTAAGGTREDLRSSPAKFSLSQYVLMLAYSNIGQWFTTLRLSDRPKHASYIAQGLVLANENSPSLSDQSMVCLDFLARFTYSNAESKPARSLLRMLVSHNDPNAAPPQGRTWLVGKGLVTINPLRRAGTFEVIVRRPSGTITMISNLENMPRSSLMDDELLAHVLTNALENMHTLGPLSHEILRAPTMAINTSEASETSSTSGTPATAEATSSTDTTESGAVDDKARRIRAQEANPIFLALQLSAYPGKATDRPPFLLPDDRSTERLLRAMDLTPVYDFHKIGVLYVGYNQTTEKEILGNTYGSTAYMRFLSRLGTLVPLRDQVDVYTGGLDRQADEHGKYAYVWRDNTMQIVFHTATLMPNHEHDPNSAAKKALIGNDWVHIVFNDSGRPYEFGTIPSQFNFVNIVISPHSSMRDCVDYIVKDDMYFHVTLQRRPGLPDFSPVGEGCLVSFAALPRFVCSLAMQSDLMSQIFLDTGESMVPYSSNWVTRLHHVERFEAQMRAKQDEQASHENTTVYDFTQMLSNK
ncbi:Tuberous sclerosis 2-like protein [Malassezia pachydermatis]